MQFPEDLVRGSIAPVVLAMLDERAMYGYEIVKLVNARTQGRLEWKEGTVYPLLHRLEGDGLIKSRWSEAPETGKPRKYYSVTRRGRVELSRRRDEWAQFSQAVNTLLMGA